MWGTRRLLGIEGVGGVLALTLKPVPFSADIRF
jgi:hypothetical protein